MAYTSLRCEWIMKKKCRLERTRTLILYSTRIILEDTEIGCSYMCAPRGSESLPLQKAGVDQK